MSTATDIETSIRNFILTEFLPGEDARELKDSTPLISAGILDSIATLRLVEFLERTFGIEMAAHETDAEHLDTVERIAQLVRTKRGFGGA